MQTNHEVHICKCWDRLSTMFYLHWCHHKNDYSLLQIYLPTLLTTYLPNNDSTHGWPLQVYGRILGKSLVGYLRSLGSRAAVSVFNINLLIPSTIPLYPSPLSSFFNSKTLSLNLGQCDQIGGFIGLWTTF